ncbi:MAG: hypothetical protein ABSH16_10590 [Sedimentisphaerales bacterium]
MNIDPIIMTDLGTDKKLNIGTLVAKVLGAIATGIAKQGVGLLPDDMVNGIGSALGKGAEMGKAAAQQGQKVLETSAGAGKDVINPKAAMPFAPRGGFKVGRGCNYWVLTLVSRKLMYSLNFGCFKQLGSILAASRDSSRALL